MVIIYDIAGRQMIINPDHVVRVNPNGTESVVHFSTGDIINSKTSMDEIYRLIEEQKHG